MYYQRAPLRFECTGCGACCTGGTDHTVELNPTEHHALRKYLRLSPAWFRRRYLERAADGEYGIRLNADGRCPFLGRDNRCRVYPVRPRQCRTYPWWPELVERKQDWLNEAKRCEGMNRGAVVPRVKIEKLVRRDPRR